jgi:hypothetical protein
MRKENLYMFLQVADDTPNKSIECPERLLWISVFDRATMDYINFFDHWVHKANSYKTPKHRPKRCNSLEAKLRLELSTLKWFFFSEHPVAYNLTWIFDHCFEGDARLLRSVREKLKQRHYLNLVKHKEHEALKQIVEVYESQGVLANLPALKPQSKFRWRVNVVH